jgi:GDP-D-mannose dehydratase
MNSLSIAIRDFQPTEIYNLAAQSFVGMSWEQPFYTSEVNALGALNILSVIKDVNKNIRFYQASTSELFGKTTSSIQDEFTPFTPRSPYGIAKLFAHWTTVNYRESYGMYACSGILFNHESPRRGLEFITKKITNHIQEFGNSKPLLIGNMSARRDWGYAKEYCINTDVPILTLSGWKYCDEVKEGDSIINFDPINNNLSTDIINKIIVKEDERNRIHLSGRSFDLTCTPEHRIYYQKKSKNSKGGWSDWKVISAQDFAGMLQDKVTRTKYDYRLPHFQDYNAKENNKWSDEEIYLLGALLAEGCISEKNRITSVSISQSFIKNEPTHKKIKDCLDRLCLIYHTRNTNSGVTEWVLTSESSKKILELFDSNDIHIAPNWIYSLSSRQANILFNSLMDCDGHWGSLTYISKRYQLAVAFQTIAILAGYASTKIHQRKCGVYSSTVISKRKKYQYITDIELIEPVTPTVWCVNTNNGTIISRDNDKISISGNCEAMWLMLQQDKPNDFVIATGETHTVKEFIIQAYKYIGAEIIFEGQGLDEIGIDNNSQRTLVKIDPQFYRPAEVDYLRGDSSKAKKILNWEPKVKFEQLVEIMMEDEA